MILYAASFISGFADIVQNALKKDVPDAVMQHVFDGLILFSTDCTPETIQGLRYFTNTFLVLNHIPFKSSDSTPSIIKTMYRNSDYSMATSLTRGRRHSFRIFVSKENELISIHKEIQHKIENTIMQLTGMTLNPLKADFEYWFVMRREGHAFFGIRLTTHKPAYAKGELHRELANILCLVSEPTETDVVLDPFCGSGAIPLERAQAFPYARIICGDNNQNLVTDVKRKSRTYDNFMVRHLDGLHLTFLEDHSINKVITDPPWGLHEDVRDIKRFYTTMVQELLRVTKPGGSITLLCARDSMLRNVLDEAGDKIRQITTYDILVSGKKATVYSLRV